MRYTFETAIGDWRDWTEMACACEEAGFASFALPDSTSFHLSTTSTYPYSDTAMIRKYIEATPFIEPMVGLTWIAANTKNIRLYPNVIKIPIRPPVVLAKLVSSLAVISDNRFMLGAGIGVWEEDFKNTGVSWAKRGELLDECLEIIAGLMTGEFYEYHSENYDISPIKLNPVPTKPVPVIIGGESKPAMRRAARIGDAWLSANSNFVALKQMIVEIKRLREEYGTSRKPFEYHVCDQNARTADDYRRLEDIGATDHYGTPYVEPTMTLQQKLDVIRRFGDEIIAETR
jgi:probable F420-dependent oxidoreductase